jgi:sugar phosphate isomerase/epimerase
LNRRQFNLSALAALGLSASHALAETFDYPWKLGIITDEADFDLDRTLKSFIPKYGLKWAEIREVSFNGKHNYVYRDATPDQLKEIKQKLDDAGVKLSVLDTAVYKIGLPGTTLVHKNPADLNPGTGAYDRQLDDLKRAADAVHALGSDQLRIFTFNRVVDPDAIFDRIVDELHKALVVAEQHDVTLVVENEMSCNTGSGTETGKLFRAIPDRRLMHNWDPGNCDEAGEQPFPKAWDMLDHSRISHIHLKDSTGKEWKPIGGGDIDFVGQFEALKKMKYTGTMSLETHYKNAAKDRYTSSEESMDGLMRVLKKV